MPGVGEWAIPAAVVGAGIVGGMVNNASSSEQAHRNREFQQKMSSTAHQREVADLKKAGLNPMLSAKNGGASAPSGAVAQTQDVLSPAVNSGISAMQARANVANTEANTALAANNARKAGVEASNIEILQEQALLDQINTYRTNFTNGTIATADLAKARQELKNLEQTYKLLKEQTTTAAAEAAYGKFAPIIKPLETAKDSVSNWWKKAKGKMDEDNAKNKIWQQEMARKNSLRFIDE